MASRSVQLCLVCMRDKIVANGHAMPFSLGNACTGNGIGVYIAPVSVFAQGPSMPISRGGPPAPE